MPTPPRQSLIRVRYFSASAPALAIWASCSDVTPETPIKSAAHLMKAKRIGCVPVVSAGTLVGLVTTTDILRYVENLG